LQGNANAQWEKIKDGGLELEIARLQVHDYSTIAKVKLWFPDTYHLKLRIVPANNSSHNKFDRAAVNRK
jgi:hypothetical protein